MHERTRYTPLTVEEQRFAEENHQVVFWYLQDRKLTREEAERLQKLIWDAAEDK